MKKFESKIKVEFGEYCLEYTAEHDYEDLHNAMIEAIREGDIIKVKSIETKEIITEFIEF